MPTSNVIVKYTPANSGVAPDSKWSQTPDPKIKVNAGVTTINWSIMVVPASAGSIRFSTDPALLGVQLQGPTSPVWPGTAPSGDANGYSATIDNTLLAGQDKVHFPYVVNAVYTPANGASVAVQYDPEVEMDPPAIVA